MGVTHSLGRTEISNRGWGCGDLCTFETLLGISLWLAVRHRMLLPYLLGSSSGWGVRVQHLIWTVVAFAQRLLLGSAWLCHSPGSSRFCVPSLCVAGSGWEWLVLLAGR